MSVLTTCGECHGTGRTNRKTCEWCEGTGQVEVPDGFRKRRTRSKADLKRIGVEQDAAQRERSPDATVIVCPPARATIRMED